MEQLKVEELREAVADEERRLADLGEETRRAQSRLAALRSDLASATRPRDVPMLHRMFQRRLRGYRAIGYARGEPRSSGLKASDRRSVEYDVEPENGTDLG